MERGRESGHGSYQPDRLAATRGATQPEGEERAATHIDPMGDAILAAWQATPPNLRRAGGWIVFRVGYQRGVEAAEQRAREAEAERDEFKRYHEEIREEYELSEARVRELEEALRRIAETPTGPNNLPIAFKVIARSALDKAGEK